MADDFFADDMFDWEDDDDSLLGIESDEDDEQMRADVDAAWAIHRQRQINNFVEAAFKNDGIPAMTEILLAVENVSGWRMEIIAEKNGIESMVFHAYDTFDPYLWDEFINSAEYTDMVYEINAIANSRATKFVRRYLGIKKNMRETIAAWFIRMGNRLD